MTISRRESGVRPIGRLTFERFRGRISGSHCEVDERPLRPVDETGRFLAKEEEVRFWAQVQPPPWWRPWGCWRWTGALTADGYGVFGVMRDGVWTKMRAHRYALELQGPIPPGSHAGHDCHDRDQRCHKGPLCGHRVCVRAWRGPWWWPAAWRRPHVLAMTRAENRRRVDARRR